MIREEPSARGRLAWKARSLMQKAQQQMKNHQFG
jgi:hypothetical protein